MRSPERWRPTARCCSMARWWARSRHCHNLVRTIFSGDDLPVAGGAMITVSNALDESPATVEDALPAALPRYQAGLDLRAAATEGDAALRLVRRDAGAVIDRLLRHVREGTTDQAVGVMREPVDHYLDQDRWRREIDQVHKRVPMPLALSCELPSPGTFKALDVADVPVLITRGRDGALHAMINACRHRGSRLAGRGTGKATRLPCPYHAWSYDLEGCLKGVYGEKSVGDI